MLLLYMGRHHYFLSVEFFCKSNPNQLWKQLITFSKTFVRVAGVLKMRQSIFRVVDLVTLKMQVAQCTVFCQEIIQLNRTHFFPKNFKFLPPHTHMKINERYSFSENFACVLNKWSPMLLVQRLNLKTFSLQINASNTI